MAQPALRHVVHLTRQLSAAVLAELVDPSTPGRWSERWHQFAQRTGKCDATAYADAVAQAVACGHFAVAMVQGRTVTPPARRWLLNQADPLLAPIFELCVGGDQLPPAETAIGSASTHIAQYLHAQRPAGLPALAGTDDAVDHAATYFFERLLSHYDSRSRRRQGVYYTPPSIASYVVRRVDQVLRAEFMLADGLADRATWQDVQLASGVCGTDGSCWRAAPFIRVLDPAMGTGVFLLEVFDHIQRWWAARQAEARGTAHSRHDSWDDYVSDSLLPRMCGQELMLPAVVLAQLLLLARLDASGFQFARPGKLRLFLGNTLCEPRIGDTWLDEDACPFTVVLGNPPFSGVSENRYRWIGQLLRGQAPGNRGVANYFLVDGQPLGEKKHWLEDDYVKFLRLAHWLIERASAGVVGFVTNHGFLDSVTFRGMRQRLLCTFPRVTVVDLHGNTRSTERPPQGGHDESVFGIEQGVAISLWRRPVLESVASRIEHAELWGQRATKLRALNSTQPLHTTQLDPHTPYYFLVPRDRRGETEYARGCPLSQVMPVNSTAAVTARDSFVVAFSEAELRERMLVLCDNGVPDEEIRQRYFTSGRSAKYPPGDTRGWQLALARERLRREPDWARYIRGCLYRPFDRRQIFWAPWMIDWPREAVMTHLMGGDNLALVARRQIPASHECNYFWVTDTIALDGLIRSDNRGSESVFPLFLAADQPTLPLFARLPTSQTSPPEQTRCANFSASFVTRFAEQLQLTWNPLAGDVPDDQFTACTLFHYIYALLHAPSYRERFAAWLRIDFPRVFIPAQRKLFHQLATLGAQLVQRHLLRSRLPVHTTIAVSTASIESMPGHADATNAASVLGMTGPALAEPVSSVRRVNERIQVNDQISIGPVPTAVWEFRVGAHQVCHKWLKDRQGRRLDSTDLAYYCQIVSSVQDTIAFMHEIDRAIAEHGGWATAFV